MLKGILAVLIMLALLIMPAADARAQSTVTEVQSTRSESFFDEVIFSIDAGISMPMGDTAKRFSMGFAFGVNGFYPYSGSGNLHFGARIAYNKWGIDEGWGEGTNADGSNSMMEFMPMARYLFPHERAATTTFFGQGGIGFYRFHYNVDYTIGTVKNTADYSEIDLGICFGGGVLLERGGRNWIVQPMINYVFTDGDSSTYLTLTVGMAF